MMNTVVSPAIHPTDCLIYKVMVIRIIWNRFRVPGDRSIRRQNSLCHGRFHRSTAEECLGLNDVFTSWRTQRCELYIYTDGLSLFFGLGVTMQQDCRTAGRATVRSREDNYELVRGTWVPPAAVCLVVTVTRSRNKKCGPSGDQEAPDK